MLRERISFAIENSGGVESLIGKIGIKKSTLYNYINGDREPKLSTLLEIAEATGYAIEWLVTGKEPMRYEDASSGQASKDVPSINSQLFSQVGKIVTRVHKEENVKLPAEALMHETANRYNELLARAENSDDLAELQSLLPWLENKVRKGLQTAANEPGSGKHSA